MGLSCLHAKSEATASSRLAHFRTKTAGKLPSSVWITLPTFNTLIREFDAGRQILSPLEGAELALPSQALSVSSFWLLAVAYI